MALGYLVRSLEIALRQGPGTMSMGWSGLAAYLIFQEVSGTTVQSGEHCNILEMRAYMQYLHPWIRYITENETTQPKAINSILLYFFELVDTLLGNVTRVSRYQLSLLSLTCAGI